MSNPRNQATHPSSALGQSSTDTPLAPELVLEGGGELGALMRDFDWSSSPVGPVEEWPGTLRTMVRLLLDARQPMFLWWGPTFTQFYNDGYRPSLGDDRHPQALGANGPAFWSDIWHIIGPEIEAIMAGGPATWHENHLVPILRDGRMEDVYWTYGYSPVRDASGTPAGVLVTVIETTNSVNAQTESNRILDRQRRQLETIAANATLALFIMDEHQQCTYMNPAAERLTGFTLEELHGKALHYHVHHTRPDGTHYPLEECPIDQAFPQNMREQGEETFVHKDGSFYEVAFTASPILENGVPVGTIIEVRDAREERTRLRERESLLESERRARLESERARQDAEHANRAKSEFLAIMSHELRTPLNAIGGYVELMEMGVRGPLTELQLADLTRVRQSQRHLLGLINQVLNYSRLEAGSLQFNPETLRLADVLDATETMIMPQVLAQSLEYSCDAGPRGLAVRADRDKLQQILLNLLSNAVKFTDAGGRLHVRASERDHTVAIDVTDTGVGIPPDKLAHIFEPFVQVDTAFTRPHEGVGLGLAISRELARGMGGDLVAESTLGQGSTFTLVLPRAVG